MEQDTYPIGTPGTPWGQSEKDAWRNAQVKRRSYAGEVLDRLQSLSDSFVIESYGELNYPEGRYPLFGLTSKRWSSDRPTVLITGGVHGYETSGVQGAMRFLASRAPDYEEDFNIACAPCISPWGYETINRWNPETTDPNRSFVENSPAQESALAMAWVRALPGDMLAHFDLHETTDTDNSEFRPALAARDGIEQKVSGIPDGFYGVGDSRAPEPEFQRAIIQSVQEVTHIAPADDAGRLIGLPVSQPGVVNLDVTRLGLCAGMTAAPYRTTTEVYPDSPRVDDENCNLAQVAAVCGGLDFLRSAR